MDFYALGFGIRPAFFPSRREALGIHWKRVRDDQARVFWPGAQASAALRPAISFGFFSKFDPSMSKSNQVNDSDQ